MNVKLKLEDFKKALIEPAMIQKLKEQAAIDLTFENILFLQELSQLIGTDQSVVGSKLKTGVVMSTQMIDYEDNSYFDKTRSSIKEIYEKNCSSRKIIYRYRLVDESCNDY